MANENKTPWWQWVLIALRVAQPVASVFVKSPEAKKGLAIGSSTLDQLERVASKDDSVD